MAEEKAAPAPDALTEFLKAFNKDSLGAFRGQRAVQGATIQGSIAAYGQLAAAAEAIAREVAAQKRSPVLLQAGGDLAELAEYRSFLRRAGQVTARVAAEIAVAKEALGEPAPSVGKAIAPAAVGALASAALALGGVLFRTEVSETHGVVTIDDGILVGAVERHLRAAGVATLPPTAVALLEPDPGGLPATLKTLEDRSQELRGLLARLEAKLPKPDKTPPEPAPEETVAAKARAEATVKALDAFWTGYVANAAKLERGAAVAAKLGGGGAILVLRVLAGGGGTRTETNNLGRDRVEHSGGVVVSYALLDGAGGVLASNIVHRYAAAEEESRGLGDWKHTQ